MLVCFSYYLTDNRTNRQITCTHKQHFLSFAPTQVRKKKQMSQRTPAFNLYANQRRLLQPTGVTGHRAALLEAISQEVTELDNALEAVDNGLIGIASALSI